MLEVPHLSPFAPVTRVYKNSKYISGIRTSNNQHKNLDKQLVILDAIPRRETEKKRAMTKSLRSVAMVSSCSAFVDKNFLAWFLCGSCTALLYL